MALCSLLDRPLIVFDLETTGTNIKTDKIVELSVVKLFPNGEKEIKTRKINPGIPIPKEAIAIHGISDEDVKDAPFFKQISKNLYIYLEGCDLAGYNIRKFDIPVLTNEFKSAGLEFSIEGRRILDAFSIYCKMEPRTLTAAYRNFCGKPLVGAHGAEADTLATMEVLEAQINRYSNYSKEELPEEISWPTTMDEFNSFCDQRDPNRIDDAGRFKWRDDKAMVSFGKYSGQLLEEVALGNPGFLKWIINADFPDDTKEIASNALVGNFPERK